MPKPQIESLRPLPDSATCTETMRRIEAMIQRKAPLLMRAGAADPSRPCKYAPLTEDEHDMIRSLFARKRPVAMIAKAIGCSAQSVNRFLIQDGLRSHHPRKCKPGTT